MDRFLTSSPSVLAREGYARLAVSFDKETGRNAHGDEGEPEGSDEKRQGRDAR